MSNKEYIFMDLETTGTPTWGGKIPPGVEIIQFVAIKTDSDFNEIARIERFYPHEEVNNGFFDKKLGRNKTFSELTGLTLDFLKENYNGMPIHEDPEVKEFLSSEHIAVAYNADFEKTFLAHFLNYHPTWKCPMKTYRNLKNRLSIKELNMLEDMGVEFDSTKLHNALYDVEMMIAATKALRQKAKNGEKISEEPEVPSPKAVDLMNNLLLKKDERTRDMIVEKINTIPNAYTAYIVSGIINNLKDKPSDRVQFMDELGYDWIRRLK